MTRRSVTLLVVAHAIFCASAAPAPAHTALKATAVGPSAASPRIETDPVRDWTDYLIVAVQVGVLGAAVASVLFLAKQVKLANALNESARTTEMSRRTADFHDSLLEKDFIEMNSRVVAFLRVGNARDAVHRIRAWHQASHGADASLPGRSSDDDAPRASKNDVNRLLGFYETMGSQIEMLDAATLVKSFGPNPGMLFARAWWYVCWRRDGRTRKAGAPDVYSEFENLVRFLFLRLPGCEVRCKPSARVRLLVLPDPGGTASGVWELCAELSRVLSERSDVVDELMAHEDVGVVADDPIVRNVIAVPADLGSDLDAWTDLVAKARALTQRLQSLEPSELEAVIERAAS